MSSTQLCNRIKGSIGLVIMPVIAAMALLGCNGADKSLSSTTQNVSSNQVLSSSYSSSAASSANSVASSASNSMSSRSAASSKSSSSEMSSNVAFVYGINAGSPSAATLDGVEYSADRFASGGSTHTTNEAITGASNGKLYQSERYGAFSYEIPVTTATYTVKLHFVEQFHTMSGARSFSVAVEGQRILDNIDLYSLAGRNGAYEYLVENVPVSDGMLTVTLVTGVENATISGIAIYSVDGGKFKEPPVVACTEAERQTPRTVNYATEFKNQQYFDQNVARAPTGPRGFVIQQAAQTLRNHTIYRPQTLMDNDKLPIVVWGNGACANDGLSQADFLSEIASHGYIVIANGAPGGGGTNNQHEAELITAMNWAIAENGRMCSQYYGKLNIDKIAAMGWSCGGGMAHYAAVDPRVDTGVALNSGLAIYNDRQDYYSRFHAPMAIFNGNSTDVAYNPGLQEFTEVTNVPVYHANHANLGHSNAYAQNNGGDMGKAAVGWLNYQLKDDMGATGRGLFFGSNCFMCKTPWTSKNKGF